MFVISGCTTGGYTRKQAKFWNNIGKNTINELDITEKTDDPDYDFANLMQVHHRSSIAMAENEIRFGLDSSLVSLAKQIVEEQQRDNEALTAYLNNNTPIQVSEDFKDEMKNFIKKKQNEARKSLKLSGITDKDFANTMIIHHLQAIEMSAMELKYGREAAVKDVAKTIIDNQEKELDVLRIKANRLD